MKEDSRVVLKKELDNAEKNYLRSIGIPIPASSKVYRIASILPNFFGKNDGITLQEIPAIPAGDCIYNMILWVELDELSDQTVDMLLEELWLDNVENGVCVV